MKCLFGKRGFGFVVGPPTGKKKRKKEVTIARPHLYLFLRKMSMRKTPFVVDFCERPPFPRFLLKLFLCFYQETLKQQSVPYGNKCGQSAEFGNLLNSFGMRIWVEALPSSSLLRPEWIEEEEKRTVHWHQTVREERRGNGQWDEVKNPKNIVCIVHTMFLTCKIKIFLVK